MSFMMINRGIVPQFQRLKFDQYFYNICVIFKMIHVMFNSRACLVLKSLHIFQRAEHLSAHVPPFVHIIPCVNMLSFNLMHFQILVVFI